MNSLKVLGIMSLVFSLVACSSDSSPKANDSEKKLFQGKLDEKVAEIYGAENEHYFTSCDYQWKDRALEISRALENRRPEIEVLYKAYLEEQASKNDNIKFVEIGSFKFRDTKKPVIGEDKWVEDTYSWPEVYKQYLEVKDQPTNLDWVIINSNVRGMIPDDEVRVAHGYNTELSKDVGPLVLSIYEKVKQCEDDVSCTLPDLSSDQIEFIKNGYEYLIWRALSQEAERLGFEKQRKYVSLLKKYIGRYTGRYGFSGSDISTPKGDTLEVPMDLRAFGAAAQQFIDYVQSVWNIDSKLKIQILEINRPSPSYLVSVGTLVGERAFVNRKEKYMQLYNQGRLRTIAHEFGHILGFSDYYFTTWNRTTCAYTIQSNEGDIMSDSGTGQVLPVHWEALKKAYWKQ